MFHISSLVYFRLMLCIWEFVTDGMQKNEKSHSILLRAFPTFYQLLLIFFFCKIGYILIGNTFVWLLHNSWGCLPGPWPGHSPQCKVGDTHYNSNELLIRMVCRGVG